MLERESDRMLGRGVSRNAKPKNPVLGGREGMVCGNRGMSPGLASERWPFAPEDLSELELMWELKWRLRCGGVTASSVIGEPKNLLVLLSAEDSDCEETDEAVVYTLRCGEREELSKRHGDRLYAQVSGKVDGRGRW